MLDYEYEASLIHCTLSNAVEGTGKHNARQLSALSRYIEIASISNYSKNKIGDLSLFLRKEETINV